MTEMEKLATACWILGIPYRKIKHDFTNSDSVILLDEHGKYLGDAVCHQFSYGWTEGLLEIIGKGCGDDVIGYLTAKEVIHIWTDAEEG